jgi:UDP:flavonoid glycosyltransferase YjiC (YdhE family)
VFVSSGGFGSSLAAFLHGVPVVGAETREGKNDINARVGHNKLGIDLRRERPKPLAIRKAVDRVLNDPTYAENGRRAAIRAPVVRPDGSDRGRSDGCDGGCGGLTARTSVAV